MKVTVKNQIFNEHITTYKSDFAAQTMAKITKSTTEYTSHSAIT